MKQNLFRVIINEDKKRKLNVWVDNAIHQQCYCKKFELLLLFKLAVEDYGKTCTDEILIDFIKTCNQLKDFSFELTETGIVYYKNIWEVNKLWK